MEAMGLIVIVGIIVFVISRIIGNSRGFDDPKPMSNEQIIAAIAGQADWLEKMSRAPFESQRSPSIMELARKRREYISQLCEELLSRSPSTDQPLYPGATKPLDIFSEAKDFAKEIESTGVSKEISVVRAVKEKLFKESGLFYPTSWEN